MRNFGIVVPGRLFRSGKYLARELRRATSRYGIECVVDLRSTWRDDLLAQSTYESIGVEFYRYPMNEDEPIPQNALDVYDGRPTLIHCWKGAHRTGAWVAKFRMETQGWPIEEVFSEMLDFGFGDPMKHRALIEPLIDISLAQKIWEQR